MFCAVFQRFVIFSGSFGNLQIPYSVLWHHSPVPDKPTSEQIRREADKLRKAATDLMEHANLLIKKSIELERRIANRNDPGKKK